MFAHQLSTADGKAFTPDDYLFYHAIDLPGLGEMPGERDLRHAPDNYLGNVVVTNKRVLDMGPTNGFLTFYMESKGASLVSYDVSAGNDWATGFSAGNGESVQACEQRNRLRKINNAYRLSHRLLNSRARLVRGTEFAIPDLVGPVDITLFGSITWPVCNPFLALRQAAGITRETIVITEILNDYRQWIIHRLFGWLGAGCARKVRHKLMGLAGHLGAYAGHSRETGGQLTPERLELFLGKLGFDDIRISYHRQPVAQHSKDALLYTLVATRTAPMPAV